MQEHTQEQRLILIVDDHAPLRTLCRVSLEEAGYRVAEAVDGHDALAAISAERPDVILLDVMMPRVSGWQVAGALLEEPAYDEIPIIFITARTAHSDRLRAFELGARDYLTKPFDPAVLPEAIETVLDELAQGDSDATLADTLTGIRAQRVLRTEAVSE